MPFFRILTEAINEVSRVKGLKGPWSDKVKARPTPLWSAYATQLCHVINLFEGHVDLPACWLRAFWRRFTTLGEISTGPLRLHGL